MDVKDVLAKYSRKMGQEMQNDNLQQDVSHVSGEYLKFKQDMMPEVSRYEGWAKWLGKIVKLKASQKDEAKIIKQLNIAHVDVQPGEVVGLAFMGFILLFFLGALFSTVLWFFQGETIADFPIFLLFLFFLASVFLAFNLHCTANLVGIV